MKNIIKDGLSYLSTESREEYGEMCSYVRGKEVAVDKIEKMIKSHYKFIFNNIWINAKAYLTAEEIKLILECNKKDFDKFGIDY